MAVTLSLRPTRALLNDVNPHVVNFYRWLKAGLKTDVKMVNESESFYEARARFNELLATHGSDSAEAAALFYYLNRTGYNGLCRFNQQGIFNVPFGRYKTIDYKADFTEYADGFGDFEFLCGGFRDVPLDDEDFVYADPPYDVEFRQYSQGGFGWDEQVNTAEWLAQHRGPVVLSNQATARVVKLYRSLGYKLRYLQAPRMISCTGDRTPAREVLATRNV